MKAMSLTEEHKSKLLEMCKVLFPEYDKLSIEDYQIDVHESVTMVGLFKENKTFNKSLLGFPSEGSKIHWFDLCINQLCPKLTNRTSMFEDIEDNKINLQIHPVDYLYGVFLKQSKD